MRGPRARAGTWLPALLRATVPVYDAQLRRLIGAFPEVGEQSLVGEIQRVRVVPIVPRHIVEAFDDLLVPYLDGQLTAVVEAAWSEVDRSDDGGDAVGEEHLCVEPQVFEL